MEKHLNKPIVQKYGLGCLEILADNNDNKLEKLIQNNKNISPTPIKFNTNIEKLINNFRVS